MTNRKLEIIHVKYLSDAIRLCDSGIREGHITMGVTSSDKKGIDVYIVR